MLIGICGGICSGKKTVAQYLVDHHGFKHLRLQGQFQATGGDGSSSSALESDDQTFSDPQDLLDFVTSHWQDRWVIANLPDESVLDLLARRPFFLLISVDAPLTLRWQRYQTLRGASSASSSSPSSSNSTRAPLPDDLPDLPTLEAFVAHSDIRLYHPKTGLQPLISRAAVRLLNTSPSLPHLYATLAKLDLPNPNRLRPSWDAYFMSLATLASLRSNCMKRRVGAVLVSGAQKRVLSTGYNGTPRGLPNCSAGGCPRCNDGGPASGTSLATCLCIHAEENALLEAGRERIRDGAVLYCDTCPCLTCSIKICQVGIKEVVYAQGYSMDTQTAAVFRQAGVHLRQFIPPPNGLIQLENVDSYPIS